MVQVINAQPRVGRKLRKPVHNFQLKTRPFQIQPFFIAPVLPGDTMKNLSMQARAVSQPIKHHLIGWWKEYYFFYVKHRDLADRQHMIDLMLEPAYDLVSAIGAAAKVETYHYAASVDYVQKCLECITDWYFRDEGEVAADHLIGNLPSAKLNMQHWMDSVRDEDDMPGGPVDNLAQVPTPSTLDDYLIQWEHMRALQMTQMSYEEWLETFGVKAVAKEEIYKPELLRYIRQWEYPSNTVDPVTGAPTGALSWSVSERADKDRFFKEPGFLFGVTVARPKVYLRAQAGAGVHMLDTALTWLPALLRDEPFTSLRKYATTTGPLPGIDDAYWVDVKDLYMHGDQFINFDPAAVADGNFVDLPNAAIGAQGDREKWYPDSDDVNALFVGATDATRLIREDGVVQLSILSAVDDTTPTYHGVP